MFRDQPREIVGVVGDIRQRYRREGEQPPQLYVPYAQLPLTQQGRGQRIITFVVRSNQGSGRLIPALRSAVQDVDRTQAMAAVQSVEQYAANQLVLEWAYATLLSIFGTVAVILALVGIYGIMAHSVNQRTSELGVRIALGAGSSEVLRVVLRRGLILIGVGIVLGFVASLALTRIVQSILFGVTATDPLTFSIALVILAAAGVLACYIPARRALKIDPIVALRYE
jgi:ABC-type antimicrobial peptide transport system permease subunit